MASDRRWLIRRGQLWYAYMDVPADARAVIKKTRLIASLKTHDLRVAKERRLGVLASFASQIAEARGKGTRTPMPAYVREALEWAAMTVQDRHGGEWTIADRAETIAVAHGKAAAKAFMDIADGKVTPLRAHQDAWIADGSPRGAFAERTARHYRRIMGELEAWLNAEKIAPTIQAVTREVAGRFVIGMAEVSNVTKNSRIGVCSSYWRWLARRVGVEGNPWSGQRYAKAKLRGTKGAKPRAFTEAELRTLLEGLKDPELADLVRLGALTGARIEELYRLRVADCAGGWFVIREAKTEAGERRIPTHPDLAGIVARRIAGKPPTAFLMHEARPPKPGRERSMPSSKRFGRHRERLGVHEKPEGQRNSIVTFHGCRRWFARAALEAGAARGAVQAVLGHEPETLVEAVYAGAPGEARLRACVEAVRLPGIGQE